MARLVGDVIWKMNDQLSKRKGGGRMKPVTYRPISEIYADGFWKIWTDPDVIQYTNIEKPCTPEEIREKIRALERFHVFAVLRGDEVIGVVGCLRISPAKDEYGFFYQFQKSVWGKGYASHAAAWMLGWMRGRYQHSVILADVITENAASEKILRHFGFQCVSEKQTVHKGKQATLRSYMLEYQDTP